MFTKSQNKTLPENSFIFNFEKISRMWKEILYGLCHQCERDLFIKGR